MSDGDWESSPGLIGLYDSGFGMDDNFDSRIENAWNPRSVPTWSEIILRRVKETLSHMKNTAEPTQ